MGVAIRYPRESERQHVLRGDAALPPLLVWPLVREPLAGVLPAPWEQQCLASRAGSGGRHERMGAGMHISRERRTMRFTRSIWTCCWPQVNGMKRMSPRHDSGDATARDRRSTVSHLLRCFRPSEEGLAAMFANLRETGPHVRTRTAIDDRRNMREIAGNSGTGGAASARNRCAVGSLAFVGASDTSFARSGMPRRAPGSRRASWTNGGCLSLGCRKDPSHLSILP